VAVQAAPIAVAAAAAAADPVAHAFGADELELVVGAAYADGRHHEQAAVVALGSQTGSQ
jgi:hypothetical protein